MRLRPRIATHSKNAKKSRLRLRARTPGAQMQIRFRSAPGS
jgi:hypothetical protein